MTRWLLKPTPFTAAANMRYNNNNTNTNNNNNTNTNNNNNTNTNNNNNNNNNNNDFITVWITSSYGESAILMGETWPELSKMAAFTSI